MRRLKELGIIYGTFVENIEYIAYSEDIIMSIITEEMAIEYHKCRLYKEYIYLSTAHSLEEYGKRRCSHGTVQALLGGL